MLTLANNQSCSKSLLRHILRHSLVLSNLSEPCCSRLYHSKRKETQIIVSHQQIEEGQYKKEELPSALWGLTDPRILYSSHVKGSQIIDNPLILSRIGKAIQNREKTARQEQAIPLIIEQNIVRTEEENYIKPASDEERKEFKVFYPYSHTQQIDIPESYSVDSDPMESESINTDSDSPKPKVAIEEEIALRMKAYDEGVLKEVDAPKGNLIEDENANDFHSNILHEDGIADLQLMKEQQGSADPTYPVSDVPCGGCGAPLHCQQPSLMGTYPT